MKTPNRIRNGKSKQPKTHKQSKSSMAAHSGDGGISYRFRAEHLADIFVLQHTVKSRDALLGFAFVINNNEELDCRMVVKSLTLDELRDIARRTGYWNLMLQTVQLDSSYTGERDFSLI